MSAPIRAVLGLGACICLASALSASAAAPATGAHPLAPKFSGFLQSAMTYDQSDLSAQAAGPDSARSSFAIKRVRLILTGELAAGTSYNLALGAEGASVVLLNAFMDRELAGSLLTLRAGQFKHPFGLEGYESGHLRPMIVLAEGTDAVAKKLGAIGGNFRDVGVQLGGRAQVGWRALDGVEYAFAVVNGSGPVFNGAKDNNGTKDLVGRVSLSLSEGVLAGGSFHFGRAENQGAAAPQAERSYGLHAQWIFPGERARVRAEYLSGFYQNALGAGRDANPLGWYVLGGWRPARPLELSLRFEDWQANRLVARGRLLTTTLGASWDVTPALTVRGNYLFRDAEDAAAAPADGTKAAGGRIGSLMALQFQAAF